jgi:hypothetical protein
MSQNDIEQQGVENAKEVERAKAKRRKAEIRVAERIEGEMCNYVVLDTEPLATTAEALAWVREHGEDRRRYMVIDIKREVLISVEQPEPVRTISEV